VSVKVTTFSVGKYYRAKIEVDGVDISNRVQSANIALNADGSHVLTLGIALYGDDAIDLELPEVDVVSAVVLEGVKRTDIVAAGDRARRYVEAAKHATAVKVL
jgi:hypothetical protein